MSDATLLERILAPDGLSVRFQPIFQVRDGEKTLHSMECLLRGPRNTNLEPADILFEYVRRKREEALVDRACIEAGLREAAKISISPRLSLNVHASTLARDPGFVRHLQDTANRYRIDPARLTLEIVEHTPAWDWQSFQRSLEEMRAIEVRIALDDIGAGLSNYRMILDSRPNYFKIDRYLVSGCSRDVYRCAVLESLSSLASKFGSRVVAEGIEDPADLRSVLALGIDLIQGYIFSRPLTVEEVDGADLERPERIDLERMLEQIVST